MPQATPRSRIWGMEQRGTERLSHISRMGSVTWGSASSAKNTSRALPRWIAFLDCLTPTTLCSVCSWEIKFVTGLPCRWAHNRPIPTQVCIIAQQKSSVKQVFSLFQDFLSSILTKLLMPNILIIIVIVSPVKKIICYILKCIQIYPLAPLDTGFTGPVPAHFID